MKTPHFYSSKIKSKGINYSTPIWQFVDLLVPWDFDESVLTCSHFPAHLLALRADIYSLQHYYTEESGLICVDVSDTSLASYGNRSSTHTQTCTIITKLSVLDWQDSRDPHLLLVPLLSRLSDPMGAEFIYTVCMHAFDHAWSGCVWWPPVDSVFDTSAKIISQLPPGKELEWFASQHMVAICEQTRSDFRHVKLEVFI